jgi:hypothetical protein
VQVLNRSVSGAAIWSVTTSRVLSLLYNALVDNATIDSDNGLKQ